jgi:hypothetical protein
MDVDMGNEHSAERHRLWKGVHSIREVIMVDPEVVNDLERNLSILARTCARYAEGTLGKEVEIPSIPAWKNTVLRMIEYGKEEERPLIAAGLSADLMGVLFNRRLQALLAGLKQPT